MAPKPKVMFRPVTLDRALTISGGHVPKKQFVVETEEFPFSNGNAPDAAIECALISMRAPWLSEIATGLAVYQRPLARVQILGKIKELLGDKVDEPSDQKMASLAFDDEDGSSDEQLATPKKKRRTAKSPAAVGKCGAPAAGSKAVCRRVQVPAALHSKSTTTIPAVLDGRRRLWVGVEFLPWLLQYLSDEKESGGVAPVEDAPDSSKVLERTRIYWNFRDDRWEARAQDPTGNCVRTSRGVRQHQKTHGVDFQTAKKQAREELDAWVQAVHKGEHVEGDADAAE